jgi:ring-1,2-phenylacetyl-CoA epoxidase subunit PaaD
VVISVEKIARPRPAGGDELKIWNLAATVVDPEVPVVTIEDLGVLRKVLLTETGGVVVELTPTYSGCPAIDAMRDDVVSVIAEPGTRHPMPSMRITSYPTIIALWFNRM